MDKNLKIKAVDLALPLIISLLLLKRCNGNMIKAIIV